MKKYSFAKKMTSDWYEDLSVVIILFLTLKIISIEYFCIKKIFKLKRIGIKINKTNKK